MKNRKLDLAIVISLPIIVSLGWCASVWDDPTVSLENKDYKHPDPITVNDPGLFLAYSTSAQDLAPVPSSIASAQVKQEPPKVEKTKPVPVTAADTGPTDWHDDPRLDEAIGSCGKRMCDCSDTLEGCQTDSDCCNAYDTCIDNKCERYEDY